MTTEDKANAIKSLELVQSSIMNAVKQLEKIKGDKILEVLCQKHAVELMGASNFINDWIEGLKE